jgi:predicted O-linked N-acetylglucosamine transferase (SPINDLY family)
MKLVYKSLDIKFTNAQTIMGAIPQALTYYYAYHNQSNAQFFKDINQFYRDICPDLNFVANWLDPVSGLPRDPEDVNKGNRKYKVGFISKYLNTAHSVLRDRSGIILNIHHRLKEHFDIHYYIFDPPESLGTNLYTQMGENAHVLPKSIAEQRSFLEEQKLDILVFCEIGMDIYTYFLSFGRYAPCQIDTWGHSDTSGQSSIDYFFSSSFYEPENGQKNYSEKLVAMDSLCTFYHDPLDWVGPMRVWKTREDFGFSDENHIYLCCQSIFKLHPDFDRVLKDILWRDPYAILLVMDSYNIRYRLLETRWKKLFGRELSRVHFLQKVPFFEFLNFARICDVFLDTYPFGGCNSSLEAFTQGKVVITQPSNVLNGRFTYGFYKKMGLEHEGAVVKDLDEYTERAIYYGTHVEERKKLEEKIKERARQCLFFEVKSVEDWANELRIRYQERLKN